MEMQVIKNKPTLELQQDEETLRAQLFALRIQKALGKLEAPHMINNLRKDIARIKTELSLRVLNGEKLKPLHINEMVLPEDKKEAKKAEKKLTKTVKVEKPATKTESTKAVKTTESVADTEVVASKAVTKKAIPAEKKVATDKKTTKPKTTTVKSAPKKTTKAQEDKA